MGLPSNWLGLRSRWHSVPRELCTTGGAKLPGNTVPFIHLMRVRLTDVECHAPALLVNLYELFGIAFDEAFEWIADEHSVVR